MEYSRANKCGFSTSAGMNAILHLQPTQLLLHITHLSWRVGSTGGLATLCQAQTLTCHHPWGTSSSRENNTKFSQVFLKAVSAYFGPQITFWVVSLSPLSHEGVHVSSPSFRATLEINLRQHFWVISTRKCLSFSPASADCALPLACRPFVQKVHTILPTLHPTQGLARTTFDAWIWQGLDGHTLPFVLETQRMLVGTSPGSAWSGCFLLHGGIFKSCQHWPYSAYI